MHEAAEEIDAVKERLYTTKQVAVIFDKTEWTIRQWFKQGKLKGTRLNNRLYFTDSQINAYANARWGDDQ